MHNRLMRGEIPIAYAVVTTHMGKRVFAEKEMTVTIASALEQSARVLSFGSFERTSQPIKDDVLAAYSGKQIQHMSIELDNADRYFSRMIAKEPFLGRNLSIYVGFESEPEATHIRLFSGTISEVSIMNTLTVEAEEA